jgi:hypothetical protein
VFYDEENGWAIPSADSAGTPPPARQARGRSMYDLIREHQTRRGSTTAARMGADMLGGVHPSHASTLS